MLCHLCGTRLIESKDGFKAHMATFHAVAVRSAKASSRPKHEVVADWEARHSKFLLGEFTAQLKPIRKVVIKEIAAPVPKVDKCPVGCSCIVCIHARLDKLLETSEVALNDARTRLGVNNELANNEL